MEFKDEIEQEMYKFLDDFLKPDGSIGTEAERYVCLNLGNLWRPRILIEIAEGYGAPLEISLPYAAGIHLTQTFTLTLDDLPSMDNDDVRRGKPACHKEFGVAIAEICAYKLLSQSVYLFNNGNVSPQQRKVAVNELYRSAMGLAPGQEMDITKTEYKNIEEIIHLYKLKSGSLFSCAATVGGIIGNAPKQEIEALRQFGSTLGVAYQTRDDLNDKYKEDKNKITIVDLAKDDKQVKEVINEYKEKAIYNLPEIVKKNSNLISLVDQILEISHHNV